VAVQRQLLAQTVNYVTKTVHLLPNFSATRTTTHFAGGPNKPWVLAGRSTAGIVYRKGEEVLAATGPVQETANSGMGGPEASAMVRGRGAAMRGGEPGTDTGAEGSRGLVTSGEFGPILGTVLLDAAQGHLAWSHWERGAQGALEAVFGFSVVAGKSHYELAYCCREDLSSAPAPIRATFGYHGELTVDGTTGVVLRVMMRADPKPGDPFTAADIFVEYGPVEIGGKTYLCPVRSGAYSVGGWREVGTWLNEVVFDQYHVFRAEAHVVGTEP
jgi:hypothetical protein